MIYNNKKSKPEPINVKGLLFSLLILAFAIFFSYAAFKSFGLEEPKAHYSSEVLHQYANIYQLKSVIFHKSNKTINSWAKDAEEIMLDEIYNFCDVAENSILKPVTSRVTHKGKPKLLTKTKQYYQITAITEFECKEQPL